MCNVSASLSQRNSKILRLMNSATCISVPVLAGFVVSYPYWPGSFNLHLK